MAHFAELDENNNVLRVVVVANDVIIEDGVEKEQLGKDFCQQLFGGNWIQTSYNGTIRKNYAGTGYTYDMTRDAFIPPKPFNSWLLDDDTCLWHSPIPYPDDGDKYLWDEDTLSWTLAE